MYKWRCFNGNKRRGSFTATGLSGTGTRTSTTCLKKNKINNKIKMIRFITPKWHNITISFLIPLKKKNT